MDEEKNPSCSNSALKMEKKYVHLTLLSCLDQLKFSGWMLAYFFMEANITIFKKLDD